MSSKIAILIPCHNEAATIAAVVEDFRRHCPEADIWVCDNQSDDGSGEMARQAGAQVLTEHRRGKGFAVRTLFRKVVADVYVLVDGDDTYPAKQAVELIKPVLSGDCDMVVGTRMTPGSNNSFRPLHRWGNQLISSTVNGIFDSNLTDVMSGYRALSRRLVTHLPLTSRGFEIETQLSIQAIFYQFSWREIAIDTRPRPTGSFSKLKTIPDGLKVGLTIVNAFKAYRPLLFFGILAVLVSLFAWGTSSLPATALALLFLGCGLILDTTNHRFRELGQLVSQGLRAGRPPS